MDTEALLAAFDDIARRRDWVALHTPKNLSMALSVEVAELCRHLQWRTDGEIAQLMETDTAREVAAELADIQMYLAKLADTLGIDLDEKMAENRRRCGHDEQRREWPRKDPRLTDG